MGLISSLIEALLALDLAQYLLNYRITLNRGIKPGKYVEFNKTYCCSIYMDGQFIKESFQLERKETIIEFQKAILCKAIP
jgi:hypothetical protein